MRARFDFESGSSRDLHYTPGAEEDLEDINFMSEDLYSQNSRRHRDRHPSSYEGHIENPQGSREKKCAKSKTGGWVSEAMLSPVEEPSDEYVDPMDELQCLVDTVSEYLAEKEEEISNPVESSRFGSSGNLSQTSSQLSETGHDSTGGSELEESFHSFHSTGLHPSTKGQPCTNGHPTTNGHSTVTEQELKRLPPDVEQVLKNDPPAERGSLKLQRFHDGGPPLPFSQSRVRWLKAINKVRVQLRER
ncbi:unnamed protein product [Menidia menidia]|uniref:(Atlantic silverside) hypothetical protein n=1 Tax=Menidia menidia TaxID=238744 RepID=A0A8S4AJZ7_9TELE|nr:unnamed protein product [Menidia menidia]